MIGQRNRPVLLESRLAVSERVRPDRVDVAPLLDVVEDRLHALIDPRIPAHLDRDKVFAILHRSPRDARSRFRLPARRTRSDGSKSRTQTNKGAAIEEQEKSLRQNVNSRMSTASSHHIRAR